MEFHWPALGKQLHGGFCTVLICLAIRKVTARKKRFERHSQAGNPRRTTAWADDIQSRIGSGSDSDSSDDDDIAERSPYKDGTSFEIANEIWRGSMIEMLTRGNQCSTESV